ncbi:MAG: STAS domain-containing protein [Phycisphaerales bacterium]
MKFEDSQHGAVVVVGPKGALTRETAERFTAHLLEIRAQSMGRLVLDVTNIPLVDSRGLEALVEVTETMADSGAPLKLCGANDTLREVLELTELTSLFDYFESKTDAARSFA